MKSRCKTFPMDPELNLAAQLKRSYRARPLGPYISPEAIYHAIRQAYDVSYPRRN